jgi:hypothetical protein
MTASARLDPPFLSVEPGETQQATLHVRNGGDLVEAYRFEVVGLPADWLTVEPAVLSLYPGTAETATVTFRPPRRYDTYADEVPFAVRVLPSERPEDAVVPEGTATILPFQALNAELLPRSGSGRRGARFQVALGNEGNVRAVVVLAADDQDEKLRYRFRPDRADLAPGEQGHLKVKVRPRRRALRGKPQRHAFQVHVADAGQQIAVLQGTYEQKPLVPSALPKVLAVTTAAAALLTAAWFGLFKPSITSAADAAANTQASHVAQAVVQKQQAAQAASASAAAAANGGPGSKTAKAATASPSPVPHPADYFTPLSVVTPSGQKGSAVYTVPKGKVFMITDIGLDNPQGDFGTLTLSIGNSQVELLALEDMRSTDIPWVTPLQVPAGGTIAVAVSCRQPGTPPGATKPTSCSEYVLLNGSLASTAG